MYVDDDHYPCTHTYEVGHCVHEQKAHGFAMENIYAQLMGVAMANKNTLFAIGSQTRLMAMLYLHTCTMLHAHMCNQGMHDHTHSWYIA